MPERQKKPFSVNSFAIKFTFGTATDESFWSKITKPRKKYGSSEYGDGQSNIKFKLPGSVSYEDVTVSKIFTEDDAPLITKLLAANTKPNEYIQVDIQPMYRDGYYSQNIGGSISLKYCTLVDFSYPDIDTIGDGAAMLEVILSPGFIDSVGSIQWWKEPTTANAN